MKTELTAVRMRILFCILHMKDKNINAAGIARGLHISKSTVSRALEYFQRENILKETGISLTTYGRELMKGLWRKKEILQEFLSEGGQMNSAMAEEEAINMILCTSEKTLETFIEKIRPRQDNCVLCEIDGFCEKCIDYLLEDGEYEISFTIYKDNSEKHMQVSMANDGFHHPGKMIVKNGVGTIELQSKKVVRPTPFGEGMLAGHVDRVSYLMNHQYENALHDGNYWKFPASCMKFTYNKGEGVLMGSTTLRLNCSVGKMYMPESIALFTMILLL